MPAPEGNKFALKPEEVRKGDSFNVRGPIGLKGLANLAAGWCNQNLTDFVLDAIREKVARAGAKFAMDSLGLNAAAWGKLPLQAKLDAIRRAYDARKR